MKMIKILFPHLLFLLLAVVATSTLPLEKPSGKIQSARVFEITGKRKIYLLAELHGIVGSTESQIDYSLGKMIFDLSEAIYLEPTTSNSILGKQATITPVTDELIYPDTKQEIKNVFTEISKKYRGNAPFLKMLADVEERIFKSTPDVSWALMYGIIYADALVSGHVKTTAAPGLSMVLLKHEQSVEKRKIKQIESDSFGNLVWESSCSQKNIVNQLLKSALGYYYQPQIFLEELLTDKSFLNPSISIDEAHTTMMKKRGMSILNQCNIYSRNKQWSNVIMKHLNQSGEPISFVLGAGHFGGDMGLLAILRINGIDYKEITNISHLTK